MRPGEDSRDHKNRTPQDWSPCPATARPRWSRPARAIAGTTAISSRRPPATPWSPPPAPSPTAIRARSCASWTRRVPTGANPSHPISAMATGDRSTSGSITRTAPARRSRPFPTTSAYGGYWPAEPPRSGEAHACPEGRGRAEKPDPTADRNWRLDEARTRTLLEALVADPRVGRVLIEPHLERRLGLWGHPKIRFAGCQAARHDDHIHVDFR